MSETLTLSNETFEYPSQGERAGWGEEATAWAVKVTELINEIFGPNDIPLITLPVTDNQTTYTDLKGLKFDVTKVQGLTITYVVNRTDGASVNNTETGTITAGYDSTNKWQWDTVAVGDSGISFDFTDLGQVQYKSTSIGGAYTGTIKFRAKTIDVS